MEWCYVAQLQGARAYMEDSVCVVTPSGRHQKHGGVKRPTRRADIGVCAVFDGHNGAQVADFCARSLPGVLHDVMPSAGDDRPMVFADSLKRSVFVLDDLARAAMKGTHDVGTTACIGVLTPTTIWVINVGDSRALLIASDTAEWEAVPLSSDHKPHHPDERRRIRSLGGQVEFDGACHRVHGLNVSRTIGDWYARPHVTHEPTVTSCPRPEPGKGYLLVGSDGLYDVYTNDHLARTLRAFIVGKGMSVQEASRALVSTAILMGSSDNVTAAIVPL